MKHARQVGRITPHCTQSAPLTAGHASNAHVPWVFGLALLSACSTGATSPTPDAPSAVLTAGNRLPAVVLQAGLQDGKSAWAKVLPALARDHRVIAFDRPGHADNPPTNAPRDPCTIAAEQRAHLQAAQVPPPYILVGHSLGGLYQFVYAKRYPEDVAGLVLLDPTHPKHWETMQQEAPTAALLLKGVRAIAFDSTDRREFDSQASCLDTLDLSQPLNIPVKLLVSGQFKAEERGAYERMVKRLRQQWLPLLGVTDMTVIEDSGHYIQKERPDAVVRAVRELGVQ